MFRNLLFFSLVLIVPCAGFSQPVELGRVAWLRDHDKALELAGKSGKPVLILFQEVPGCATCRNYGQGALSHPLLVEAIETLFVPLCIYNNKQGEDLRVLKRYGEPTWNNPVVRIVNERGEDVAPRLAADYSAYGLCGKMITALRIAGHPVPGYLSLLEEELRLASGPKETAYLSMYCFWTGEKVIGQMEGVSETEAGYMDGKEVVRVTFDPGSQAFDQLVEEAHRASCADGVYTDKAVLKEQASEVLGASRVRATSAYRKDREDKYYLRKSDYRKIPMTPYQAQHINSLLGQGKDPSGLLSPRQLELYRQRHQDPSAPEVWNSEWTL